MAECGPGRFQKAQEQEVVRFCLLVSDFLKQRNKILISWAVHSLLTERKCTEQYFAFIVTTLNIHLLKASLLDSQGQRQVLKRPALTFRCYPGLKPRWPPWRKWCFLKKPKSADQFIPSIKLHFPSFINLNVFWFEPDFPRAFIRKPWQPTILLCSFLYFSRLMVI